MIARKNSLQAFVRQDVSVLKCMVFKAEKDQICIS